jgi:hypothetical protein
MINSLHNLPVGEAKDGTSETLVAFLCDFTQDTEGGVQGTHDDAGEGPLLAVHTPLQRLDAGTWRSLGGYFDYSGWTARERFMELDKAIASDLYRCECDVEPDTHPVTTSPFRVVTEELMSCREGQGSVPRHVPNDLSMRSQPVHPVALLEVARDALRIDALDDMIRFVMAAQSLQDRSVRGRRGNV